MSGIEKKMEELLSAQREKLEKLVKSGKLAKETKAKSGGSGKKVLPRLINSGTSQNGPSSSKKYPNTNLSL